MKKKRNNERDVKKILLGLGLDGKKWNNKRHAIKIYYCHFSLFLNFNFFTSIFSKFQVLEEKKPKKAYFRFSPVCVNY